jgi:hypothetical protein
LTPAGQQAFDAGITDVGVFGLGGDVPLSRFLAIQGSRALPSTVAAGAGGKALQVASKGAVGLGAGSVVAEAGLSGATGAAAQAADIDNRSTASLLQTSEKFRNAYNKYQGLSEPDRDLRARSDLKADALATGGLASALAVGAGSAVAGRLLKGAGAGVFDDSVANATGLLKAGTRGAGREAVQEGAQSALESIAQDLTTGTFTDPAALKLDNLLVNALESAVEGAVIGSAVGGTIGSVTGQVNATRESRIKRAEELRQAELEKGQTPAAESAPASAPVQAIARREAAVADPEAVSTILERINKNGQLKKNGEPGDTVPRKELARANRATLKEVGTQLGLDVENLDDAQLLFRIRRAAGDTTALTSAEAARAEVVQTALEEAQARATGGISRAGAESLLEQAIVVEDDRLQPSKGAQKRILENLQEPTHEARVAALVSTIGQFEKNTDNTDNADVAKRILASLTTQPAPAPAPAPVSEPLPEIEQPTIEDLLRIAADNENRSVESDVDSNVSAPLPEIDLFDLDPLVPGTPATLNEAVTAPQPLPVLESAQAPLLGKRTKGDLVKMARSQGIKASARDTVADLTRKITEKQEAQAIADAFSETDNSTPTNPGNPAKPIGNNESSQGNKNATLGNPPAQEGNNESSLGVPSGTLSASELAALYDVISRQKPVTEQPVTEQPVTEQPVTEQPVTEQPVTEQPAAEGASVPTQSTALVPVRPDRSTGKEPRRTLRSPDVDRISSRVYDVPGLGLVNLQDTDQLRNLDRPVLNRIATTAGIDNPAGFETLNLIAELQTEGTGFSAVLANPRTLELMAEARNTGNRAIERYAAADNQQGEGAITISELEPIEVKEFVVDIKSGEDAGVVGDILRLSKEDQNKIIAEIKVKTIKTVDDLVFRAERGIVKNAIMTGRNAAEAKAIVDNLKGKPLREMARELGQPVKGLANAAVLKNMQESLPDVPVRTRNKFNIRSDRSNSLLPNVSNNTLIQIAEGLNQSEQASLTEIAQRHPEVLARAITVGLSDGATPSEIVSNAVGAVQLREDILDQYTSTRNLAELTAADNAAQRFSRDSAAVAAQEKELREMRLSAVPDIRSGAGITEPNQDRAGLTPEQVADAIKGLQGAGLTRINIAGSIDDLPQAGKEHIARFNPNDRVKGMFLAKSNRVDSDQVWLIAPNIQSRREAVLVALHELVHLGLGRVFGRNLNRVLLDVYGRNHRVRSLANEFMADRPGTDKLTAIEEVLAEMAGIGEVRALNLWDRIKTAISDWLFDKLGIDIGMTDAAVEEIVAGARRTGLADGMDVFTASRVMAGLTPDIRLSAQPIASPAQAMDKVDGVMSSLAKAADNYVPSVTGWLNKQKLDFSTGNFLASYHARIFSQEIQDAIVQQNRAERVASATIAKHGKDLSAREQEMNRLSEKDQTTFNELAGESTRLGIYPNKPFEEQKWLHDPKDKARNRNLHNRLQQMYRKPEIKAVYDNAIAHNERDLEMTFASLLRSIAFSFDVPKAEWRKVDPLDAVSSDAGTRDRFKREVEALAALTVSIGGEPAATTIKNMREFRANRLQGPYFHLGRYGDYFVQFDIAKNPEAQQAVRQAMKDTGLRSEAFVSEDADHVFFRFETQSALNAQVKVLSGLERAGHIDNFANGKVQENLSKLDFTNVGFMQKVLVHIDSNVAIDPEFREQHKELVRRTMVEMLPEMSGSKALARRKGTPGYSLDMRRGFVKRSRANMFFVAQNTAQPEVMDALKTFRSELTLLERDTAADTREKIAASEMFDHIKKRHNNALKPLSTPVLDYVSSLGFSMFLASNIPYIIANFAQPFQTTLPVLGGKFGFTKASTAMFNSYKAVSTILKDTAQQGWVEGEGWRGVLDAHIVVNRAGLTPAQTRAMTILVDSGVVEFTQAHGLARVEQGADANTTGTVVKVAGMMSHYSEAANRMVTGLAAFDMEFERLKRVKPSAAEDDLIIEAARYAEYTIDRTQFNYDPANRGYAFSKNGVAGKLTPLFTGFMQFNMQMMQLLVDLTSQSFNKADPQERTAARKALAGIMATTTIFAGVMGLPFMTAIAAIYNGMGDDDDPRELRADFTRFLSDLLGPDMANAIAHGAIDPVTGATLSTRLSLGDLIPATEFLHDRREFSDKLDSLALSTLGPSIGAMANMATGAAKMADGDIFKGMALMMPAALQGFVKGPDLLLNGYTDMRGNKLPIAATDWEIMIQFLNFTPALKTELQRNARSFTTQSRLLSARKTDLGREMAKAIESGNNEAISRKAEELIAFQTRNPDLGDFDIAKILTNQQRKLGLAQALQVPGGTQIRDAYRLSTAFSGLPTAALQQRLAEGR